MLRHATVLVTATLVALATGQAMLHGSRAAVPTIAAANTGSPAPPPGAAEVGKAADGHYWAEADVDGTAVHMLVDTGASAVALTPQDAARLGLHPADLTFDRAVSTAHGQTQGAEVTLDHVGVGAARVEHVRAVVVREGLSASLLGMTYLGRLSRIEATPAALILRP